MKEVVDAIMEKLAEELAENMRVNIKEKNAIATGALLKSIASVKVRPLEYVVGSDCPYAVYVEYGTEPHTPPFDAILKWVEVKLQLGGAEAREVAAKVVRKIAREGTEPKSFITPAVFELVWKYRGENIG
ncbi:MAG: HK97 gp10 family phage protein [Candidatus Bathycorpusculaceae bacterium]